MWRKSSFSDNPSGNCVEVALTNTAAAVRDSKNAGGPTLRFPDSAWKRLLWIAVAIRSRRPGRDRLVGR
jgi:hypothetical protein